MTKMLSPRVVVAAVPNPFHRCYHVNTQISTNYIETFHLPLHESPESYIKKVGPIGAELVRKLNDIPGVTEATLHKYEVGISIGEAFQWPDIENDVLDAIKACFGDRKDEVEVVRKDNQPLYRCSALDDDFA